MAASSSQTQTKRPDYMIRNEKIKQSMAAIKPVASQRKFRRVGEDENGNFNNEIWTEQLKSFLFDKLLPVLEPNPQLRLEYVSEPAMAIWIIAFTAASFDPTPGNNFEVLEKIGDAAMKIPFFWFLLERYPSMTHSQLSPSSQYYLSKPEQAKESVKLGLDKFARSYYKNNIHVYEDVLESFFGAIFFISKNILARVSDEQGRYYDKSSHNCDLMIRYIYKDLNINNEIRVADVPEINLVKEIFEKMKWKKRGTPGVTSNIFKEIEDFGVEAGTGKKYFSVKFNDAFFDWLDKYNAIAAKNGEEPIVIEQTRRSPSISRIYASTKKIAKPLAYGAALNFLTSIGIDWDWADKNSFVSSNVENVKYLNMAYEKSAAEGFATIHFSKDKTYENGRFIQLIGTYHPEEEDMIPVSEILITIDGVHTIEKYNKGAKVYTNQMQRAALLAYLKYGRHPEMILYEDITDLN